MAIVYLVWNAGMNECVGFLDRTDAQHAATGRKPRGSYSALADHFREVYGEDDEGDDALQLVITEIDVNLTDKNAAPTA